MGAAGIVGLSAADIEECDDKVEHACPSGYQVTGGYHCKTHKGCQAEEYGPFPEADCDDQCHIKGSAKIEECSDEVEHSCPADFAQTGGYHCKEHKGCRYEKDGPFPEDSCKAADQCYIPKAKMEACGDDVAHQCPVSYATTGGYHCKTHKGCQSEKQGPFPDDDCDDQCHIEPATKKKDAEKEVNKKEDENKDDGDKAKDEKKEDEKKEEDKKEDDKKEDDKKEDEKKEDEKKEDD